MTTTDTTSTATTTTTSTVSALTSSGSNTSSTSSSIDWDALIEATVAAEQVSADSLDLKIAENELEIAAYTDMQSLLQDLETAAEAIRGTGSLTSNDDIFSYREAYLTANGDVSASSALVVTVDEGTTTGTYDLEIDQLATAHKIAGDSQTDAYTDLGLSGVVSIGLENMTAVEFTITGTMSLAEIAEEINGSSSVTGVSASVIQVDDGDFRLVLSGTETGQAIQISDVSGTHDIGEALGLIADSSGTIKNELQAAQDAVITLDGITITRDSNTIDDVLDGVTLNLYQETGTDNSISVEIASDLTSIKSAITNFVDAYNAYREFALTQQEVTTGGGASSESTLFGDSTLRSANRDISGALGTVIDGNTMAFLGLSYDSSNYLVYDEDTLNDALLNNLDEVEKMLTFQMDSSSNDVALLSRSTNMPDSLQLDITVDGDGNMTGVSVGGDDSLFEVSGTRIKGVAGTDYEGITFVFTGDSSQTVDLTFSSGLVEELYNAVNSYSDASDGLLSEMITDLTETTADYQEESDEIRDWAEGDFRDYITTLYAGYQAAIEEAESMLDYLTALLEYGND
ncbi:flagellar filament capping protein FliD [Roseibium sp. RKSG952]|uniref:flagellar filament capping protein FliD n=1 Tax=Roseibium sp. RKSG952 TaxID=2529384 RepID=UPI0013CB4D50|nr:flagellar hook protein [Roseibium sp. RKSG952]